MSVPDDGSAPCPEGVDDYGCEDDEEESPLPPTEQIAVTSTGQIIVVPTTGHVTQSSMGDSEVTSPVIRPLFTTNLAAGSVVATLVETHDELLPQDLGSLTRL